MARLRPKGHKMIATSADGRPKTQGHAPVGGYMLSCSCGWDGGTCRIFKDAEKVFTTHLEVVARYTCNTCSKDISTDTVVARRKRTCSACIAERKRADAARAKNRNPSQYLSNQRSFFLKSKYGVTSESVDLMLRFQGGECKICRRELHYGDTRSIHLDHCHTTGRLRGILCTGCNTGLGSFQDNPASLVRAAMYLVDEPNEANQRPIPYHERFSNSEKLARKPPDASGVVDALVAALNLLPTHLMPLKKLQAIVRYHEALERQKAA